MPKLIKIYDFDFLSFDNLPVCFLSSVPLTSPAVPRKLDKEVQNIFVFLVTPIMFIVFIFFTSP